MIHDMLDTIINECNFLNEVLNDPEFDYDVYELEILLGELYRLLVEFKRLVVK